MIRDRVIRWFARRFLPSPVKLSDAWWEAMRAEYADE